MYTLLVWPVTEFLMFAAVTDPGSYRDYVIGDDPILDNGPMWFVGVLLLVSVGYAAWSHQRGHAAVPAPLRGRFLVWVAVAIGASTFFVRIVLPIGSTQALNIHLWQWPQVLGAFWLGAIAGERGWFRPVRRRLTRRSGFITLAVAGAVGASIVGTIAVGGDEAAFAGGWSVPAFFAAMSEGTLVVAGSIWTLAWAQRHLDRTSCLRRAMARSSYAAFMLQGPVLVALAMGLRPMDLPGDVKALIVAALGIFVSFAGAHALVRRTVLRRVL